MKISINNLKEGINARSHRKEDKFNSSLQIVSFDPTKTAEYHKGFNTNLDVRFYGSGTTVYCCIWGSIKGTHFNGSGKAGGYGYDKKSAAFASALISAGFNVDGLSCTGENETAIDIIAIQLMGLECYTIIRSHG